MTITPQNIIRHELIGLSVSVADSRNKSNKHIKGVVVDETQKTLVVSCEGKDKCVFKKTAVFQFQLSDGKVNVDGTLLYGRSWDRIKRKLLK